MRVLLHLAAASDWAAALREGAYRTPSLAEEGFIHCCTESQLDGVVERYYRDRNDLILLRIAPAHVESHLRWETPAAPIGEAHAEERFPHLYAPLSLDAVLSSEPYRPSR